MSKGHGWLLKNKNKKTQSCYRKEEDAHALK